MTNDRSDADVGAILDTWMEAVAPARAPERLLEDSFARTMVTGQARGWPWHGLRGSGQGGSRARRTTTAAFAAGALVLTAVVVTSLVAPRNQTVGGPTPRPSTAPSAGGSPSASPTPLPSAVLIQPTAEIPVTGTWALTTDGSSIWLLATAGTILRIDPATNTIATTGTLDPPTDAYQTIAGDRNGVWVTDWDANSVTRLDPRTLKSVATIDIGSAPKGVLVTTAAVWIADTHGGSVVRLDPKTNKIVATILVGPTGPSGPNWLARGSGSIWTNVPNIDAVVRINEDTNAIEAVIPVPATQCGGLAAGSTAIWITSCDGAPQVTQIDPTTNTVVATVDLGSNAYTFALVADRPWLSPSGGQIVRLNPLSHAIDRVVAPGSGFAGGGDLVVAAGSMWVIDYAANRLLRLPISAFGG